MNQTDPQATNPSTSSDEVEHRRGTDDRRGEVKPEENPLPSSPTPDEEALRKGEEILSRVKPY